MLCKKIRSKFTILKKFATCTTVSTKLTNRVASKKHTSGIDKYFFSLSDIISRGLRGKPAEESDQNSEKKFAVPVGLMQAVYILYVGPWFFHTQSTFLNVYKLKF
jgi:hypothetical protein